MKKRTVQISETQQKTIESILQKGNCVELIPNKDGFRIIEIIRKEGEISEDVMDYEDG